VVAAHGVRGELKIRVITDFPKQRFARNARVYIGRQQYSVGGVRMQGQFALLRLHEVTDRTTADKLRGLDVEVPTSDALPLPKGQFYWHEVIGLTVIDITSGEALGTVKDILETGANDVYVVQGKTREILVPAIKDIVKTIDPKAGRMLIEPLPGLL
jgi:16S rRNA processing protein RimM